MLDKLKEVVAEGLGVAVEEIVETASFKEDLGADSLDLFEIVMAMEEELGVEIPTEQLQEIVTVGDAIKCFQAIQD